MPNDLLEGIYYKKFEDLENSINDYRIKNNGKIYEENNNQNIIKNLIFFQNDNDVQDYIGTDYAPAMIAQYNTENFQQIFAQSNRGSEYAPAPISL